MRKKGTESIKWFNNLQDLIEEDRIKVKLIKLLEMRKAIRELKNNTLDHLKMKIQILIQIKINLKCRFRFISV